VTLVRYTAVVAGVAGLSWLAVAKFLDGPARGAVGFSAALTTINTIAAFAIVTWAAARPLKPFLAAVFGGMLARLAALLVAVGLAISHLGFRTFPLVAALFVYFSVFLAFELAVVNRTASPHSAPR
jgi:hypothetical protein